MTGVKVVSSQARQIADLTGRRAGHLSDVSKLSAFGRRARVDLEAGITPQTYELCRTSRTASTDSDAFATGSLPISNLAAKDAML